LQKPIRRSADGRPTWKKSRLNWKLKISNTADNTDITQSQAHDTKHRRMQEVNSLCTDSGPLQVEYCIVALHTIQPSSLKIKLTTCRQHNLKKTEIKTEM